MGIIGRVKRNFKMPILTFGKYKDQNIADVPTSYLQWLEENTKDVTQQMASDELKRRAGESVSSKLPRSEWMGELAKLIDKMPDGLLDQTIQWKNFEVKVRIIK